MKPKKYTLRAVITTGLALVSQGITVNGYQLKKALGVGHPNYLLEVWNSWDKTGPLPLEDPKELQLMDLRREEADAKAAAKAAAKDEASKSGAKAEAKAEVRAEIMAEMAREPIEILEGDEVAELHEIIAGLKYRIHKMTELAKAETRACDIPIFRPCVTLEKVYINGPKPEEFQRYLFANLAVAAIPWGGIGETISPKEYTKREANHLEIRLFLAKFPDYACPKDGEGFPIKNPFME